MPRGGPPNEEMLDPNRRRNEALPVPHPRPTSQDNRQKNGPRTQTSHLEEGTRKNGNSIEGELPDPRHGHSSRDLGQKISL